VNSNAGSLPEGGREAIGLPPHTFLGLLARIGSVRCGCKTDIGFYRFAETVLLRLFQLE
jgi:hypothetical protein